MRPPRALQCAAACASFLPAAAAPARLLRRGARTWAVWTVWMASALCGLTLLAAPAAWAQRTSTGTGFFITEDGYFITCFHVVVNSGKITLRNLKGETFEARAIAVDRTNDLALLKAEKRDGVRFKPLPLGASGDVRRGAAIVTMGFPNISQQGIEPKVTDGIINSFSGANNDPRVFQISAPIQTGNSGGPLITMDGSVIGVVASKLDAQAIARQTGDIPQNVNYAIKSQYVHDMLDKVAAQIPAVRDSLARPLPGDKARVADVVPALEDAIALVLATPATATPAAASAAPRAAEEVQNDTGRRPESGSQSGSQGIGAVKPAPSAPVAPLARQDSAPQAPPQLSSPAQQPDASPDARQQRMGRMVAEYRQLQQQLNRLNFDELTLLNQANMLRMMLRFDQGGTGQRQADLTAIQRRLDDIGTHKAETVKRMNELALEYRQLQPQGGA